MPLDGMSILDQPSGHSLTDGTPLAFERSGQTIANGVRVSDTTETDWRLKKIATFKSVDTNLQSDGSYSKARRSVTVKVPFILADGTTSSQLVRVEAEIHPEFAAVAGNLSNLRYLGAQVLIDSDTDSFYNNGTLS